MGYDLSRLGSYQVQFTTGLWDVTDDVSLAPRKQDSHQPQSLSCNTVRFGIVPAPEPPTATPSPTVPAAMHTPSPELPAGLKRHVDTASGVAFWVPESWTVIEPGPHGGPTHLLSYPEDKYVGGEGFKPGDTKCDLYIHPLGTSVADVVPRNRVDPPVAVVSEQEIVLRSGQLGRRFEVESMGRSLSLITTLQAATGNERVVVLTCLGELAPFDEIALTLGAGE
jgi:hypothetical protein